MCFWGFLGHLGTIPANTSCWCVAKFTQIHPIFPEIFLIKLKNLQIFLLLKVVSTLKLKILPSFQKSPKLAPNFWALFALEKSAQGFKKAPKWREIAPSGHTGCAMPNREHFFQRHEVDKAGMSD